jgi:hypothetical protein
MYADVRKFVDRRTQESKNNRLIGSLCRFRASAAQELSTCGVEVPDALNITRHGNESNLAFIHSLSYNIALLNYLVKLTHLRARSLFLIRPFYEWWGHGSRDNVIQCFSR